MSFKPFLPKKKDFKGLLDRGISLKCSYVCVAQPATGFSHWRLKWFRFRFVYLSYIWTKIPISLVELMQKRLEYMVFIKYDVPLLPCIKISKQTPNA